MGVELAADVAQEALIPDVAANLQEVGLASHFGGRKALLERPL